MDFMKPTILAIPFFLVTFTLEWWAVKAGRANGRYETSKQLPTTQMPVYIYIYIYIYI